MKASKYKFKNKRAKKVFILPTCLFFAGLFFLLLGILLATLSVLKTKKSMDKEVSYRDFILQDKQGERAVVNLELTPKSVPEKIMKSGRKQYVFVQADKEYFVLCLTEKQLKKLTSDLADAKEKVKVTGYTQYLFDKLKTEMVPFLKTSQNDENVSKYSVTRYTGAYFVNYQKVNLPLMVFTVGKKRSKAAIVLLIIALVLLIAAKKNKKKAVTFAAYSANSYPVLDNEMNNLDGFWFDTLKIYATKNYLIGTGLRLKIVKYQNLVWMYDYQQIFMETPFFHKVMILDTKGDLMTFTLPAFGAGKNGRIAIEMKQLSEKIQKVNDKVVFGNTAEIREEMAKKITGKAGKKFRRKNKL